MSFKKFLNEQKSTEYKKSISTNEAIQYIKKYCKNVDIEYVLWRGWRNNAGKDCYLVEGGNGVRPNSIDTYNHYRYIIDNFIHEPKRQNSIICTTEIETAKAYSYKNDLYAIFPFDDTTIAMFDDNDIWNNTITIGTQNHSITEWNDIFSEYIQYPKSYNEIVEALSTMFEKDDKLSKNLVEAIQDEFEESGHDISDYDNKEIIDIVLEQKYSTDALSIDIGTYKTLHLDTVYNAHECWMSGKCIAIRKDIFDEIDWDN